MESPDIPSPRHKQMVEEKIIVLWRTKSQGSVERANQDVENIVAVWKRDNNRSDWAAALPIIQYTKNARHHTGIGRSPFRAMFHGQTVLLAIPDVDKGRCEFPNLKCVVLEKNAGGMYR